MKNKNLILILAAIFCPVIFIIGLFVAFDIIDMSNIPAFGIIMVCAALLLAPFVVLIAQNGIKKKKQENTESATAGKNPFSIYLIAYGIVLLISLVLLFIFNRNFLLPFLLCQTPLLVYFLVIEFKNRKKHIA